MGDHLVLPENNSLLNRAAFKWLTEARGDPVPHYLHLLSLAAWGLEQGVEGEWPIRDRGTLEMQVGALFGWEPKNVLEWLVSNPDGPDPEEQQEDLRRALVSADNAKQASALVLNQIYSRMQSELPALQPAASELR